MLRNTSSEDISFYEVELRQAVMTAFCNVLHGSRLPPMTVLSMAAEALGSVYKEIYDAHRGDNACPCGWQPDPRVDIAMLQTALAMTARILPEPDLRRMATVGRA
ncbi:MULTISPECIES: hypothetical protein [unclassified Chelatococcus]|uniref:hypothetical protein n=2 Tax=Chelatococcus TaxID=28209 RepID=UPI001BCF22BE|nr:MULTISPECIES: hypothetical protein [unclassified Chelatococcus]MBS7742091.1 hypothetical protein [Chelatococcus sp. HY11]MCO5074994.1 hypothetical protein [Chelatococcus sp.]CAH1648032.1 conserved hypothetical protein [Hyphomicrobiales bacterium]CAH1690237.1 conserved hypothetical protein [Hyphomicrobiales bacterium]